MRFHKTINVSYEMIYDSVTHEEHTELYSLLPTIQELALENKKFKQQSSETQDWQYVELMERRKKVRELQQQLKEKDKIIKDFRETLKGYKGGCKDSIFAYKALDKHKEKSE